MTNETHDAKPVPCHFCKADQVITMPNDRAGIGGIPQGGTIGQDAFYCHCEGCGADGPIADDHPEAITLWNGPTLPVQKHDADTVERVAVIEGIGEALIAAFYVLEDGEDDGSEVICSPSSSVKRLNDAFDTFEDWPDEPPYQCGPAAKAKWALTSILSAIPPQEVSVTVNPLEWWEPRKDNNYTHGAKTIFGTYYVGICGGRHSAHAEFFHETGAIEQFLGPDRGSLEEAKDDAALHHQGRILSAVTVQEVSVQAVEALNWVERMRSDAVSRADLIAREDVEVLGLCRKYGFGAVMDSASRQWVRIDNSGAFFIGGCVGDKSALRALSEKK